MVKLQDLPLVMPMAEWVWGVSTTASSLEDDNTIDQAVTVSAEICLDMFPFFNGACFSQLLTKALGVAIILGACLNKAPIMRNMLQAQSAAGFSRLGMYSETLVYANGAAYGMLESHPVTAYGENLALLLQNCILIYLIWKFTVEPQVVALSEKMVLGVCAIAYVVVVGSMLPPDLRYLLQASNAFILIYSRGAQVWEVYQVKHTGAQSIVTIGLNLVGGLIRILTTLQETGDMAVLFGFLLSVALNFIMFSQYWLYQQNTQEFLANLQADQKKKKE